MLQDFRGRVAVVTGAGSGIGRSLTVALAAEGMNVVAADIESKTLKQTAASVGSDTVTTCLTDVRDPDAVEALADTAYEAFGAVHLLCNNAGVFQGGVLWERTNAELEWVLGVNLWGHLNAIRSFIPRMLAAGESGHIVNTASMAGLVPLPFSGPYVVSKYAAVAVSESIAHDLAMAGAPITVSVLCPSLVATEIGTSYRNAPPDLRHHRQPQDVEFVEQALVDSTTQEGMAPDEVARIVIDAVRAGDFYIGTKPSFDTQIRERTEALLARRLPPVPAID